MQFGIISGAMLACLLRVVGTQLEMILNVSLPHLLCLITRLFFSPSPPSVKVKIRHAYHSVKPVNHNCLQKVNSSAEFVESGADYT